MTSPDIVSCQKLFRTNAASVLFVTSQLRPRELKMASGLRGLGWTVGLIYFKWTPFDPHAYFDFCFEVGSAKEAHNLAKRLSPRISHVFSGAIDDLVLQFCRQKPSPVVIDLNDVFAPSLFNYCHERFEPTREALSLADGFCARDLQVKSAERLDGFRLPPRLVFFPEYCWNKIPLPKAAPERAQSGDVHVVSVGTFSLETQGMYDSCYLRLAKMLIEQQIHLHIYPHWAYRRDHSGSPHANFEKDFADFLTLQKANPHLHLHESLSTENLANVLPQYDFGIVSGGAEQFGQKLAFYHAAYLETCYSGRISDYLDARLPVLINDEVKFDYWLLKRYGICVDLKGVLKPGFRKILLNLKRDPRQRETMERAAQKLSVDFNTPRLATFYQEVIAAGASTATATRPVEADHAPIDELSEKTIAATLASDINVHAIAKERFFAVVKENIRWASPRLAKILLPYRAIRIFQVRLHNALQEIQTNAATISALRTRVGSLEHEAVQFRAQLAALEQDKTALNANRLELEQYKTLLSTQVEDLTQVKTALSVQVAGLEQDKATLNANLAGLEQDKAYLTASVTRLGQDTSALSAQVEDLTQVKTALSVQVAGLEQDKANLTVKVTRLEQDKSALSAQVAGLAQEQIDLRAQVASLEQDKTVLSTRLTGLEQIKAALNSSVAGLEQDKADFRNQVAGLKNDKVALNACVAGLEQDKVALRTQLAALEVDKQEFRTHTAGLEQAKAVLGAQLTRLEQDKAALGIQVSSLEQGNAELLGRSASLQADLRSFTEKTERERLIPAAHQLSAKLWGAIHSSEEEFQPIDNEPKLLLACMPKSGSTWLTSILEAKLALPPMRCYLEADRNEQEIDTTVLFQAWGQRVLFVHQHIRYSRILMRICRAFSTKIIVLTRRLDDIVVSLRDHLERESHEVSMFYTESEWFKNKSQNEQFDFIIDHAMPWYFNFYLGWLRTFQSNNGQILMVRYEELIEDTVACVEKIASFYGTPVHGLSLSEIDLKSGTRFNQGRAGRGREMLSKKQIARLRKLASYYPGCDFESVGL